MKFAHGLAWFCTATTSAALGDWDQATMRAWVVTELAPAPMMVSLVQAAAQLPVLFLVVPTGALADLENRRGYLILTSAWMLFIAGLLVGPSLGGILVAVGGAALAWRSKCQTEAPQPEFVPV